MSGSVHLNTHTREHSLVMVDRINKFEFQPCLLISIIPFVMKFAFVTGERV